MLIINDLYIHLLCYCTDKENFSVGKIAYTIPYTMYVFYNMLISSLLSVLV